MTKIIQKIKRSISKILLRVITDMVKHLLRCFLEDVQKEFSQFLIFFQKKDLFSQFFKSNFLEFV